MPDRFNVRRGGELAKAYLAAEADFAQVQEELENLLDSLFDSWVDYEVGPPAAIDVYGVVPSPVALATLQRAGFAVVHQHDHGPYEFTACACRARPLSDT